MRSEDFERLYQEHSQALYAFLVYRVGNESLAEDLLADTFERVLRSHWRFDRRRSSEKTWLYTIALNLLRDGARRETVAQRAMERVAAGVREEDSSSWADELQHRDQISRALPILTIEEREAISLRYGGDLTVPEIAKVLDEKVSTVEGRVYRALRKLRVELE
ncbi:MAG TPA: RNA polymerase sigma factor [Streptosporangiaceae bacterium]|jgi:RNA polymerase sigma-70 factor (ECF subfamily)|nr:RNA polymerase sigma factor [Streptosporangiaceae bacterium]